MPSYRIEYHRVWVKTIEAETRKEARLVVEEEMNEESDAEDYNYVVVKKQTNRVASGSGDEREVKGNDG